MDSALLNLLRCPMTRQPLRLVTGAEADALGRHGQDALMRADGQVYYLFDEDGLPVLLPEAAVPVTGGTPD